MKKITNEQFRNYVESKGLKLRGSTREYGGQMSIRVKPFHKHDLQFTKHFHDFGRDWKTPTHQRDSVYLDLNADNFDEITNGFFKHDEPKKSIWYLKNSEMWEKTKSHIRQETDDKIVAYFPEMKNGKDCDERIKDLKAIVDEHNNVVRAYNKLLKTTS